MAGTGSAANYASGKWGKGQFDIKELAAKYGLDRSNPGRTEHDIYGKDAEGNEVYIGRSNMGMSSNRDLIAAHAAQAHPDEVDHSSQGENLSSTGDIRGAILNQWDGSGFAPAAEEAPKDFVPSQAVQDLAQEVADGKPGGKNYVPIATMNTGDKSSGDPYQDAIDFGNDANRYFQEVYLPQKEKEAKLAAKEIGESGIFHLNRFIGKVPELGDIRELTDHYVGYIKDA
tara:strand:+ start:2615 stop:3301 length:687 start_codon:yes stop_codon:yes gene_type:complete